MTDNGPAFVELEEHDAEGPAAGRTVRDRFTTNEVFERVIATAKEEIATPARQLLLSGVAAGLCAGATLLATVNVKSILEGVPGAEIAAGAFYGLGFVFIVLGRYQLFTENTLTPVMLVLERKGSLLALGRLWGLVLLGNVIGAVVMALVLHYSGVFDERAIAVLTKVGHEAVGESAHRLFWSSIFAGVLVATMVWIVMAVRTSMARLAAVLLITSVIPIARLHHCIFGTAEVLFSVLNGGASLGGFARFFALAVLGNTVGGVVFVSLLNYAQTEDERDSGVRSPKADEEPEGRLLVPRSTDAR